MKCVLLALLVVGASAVIDNRASVAAYSDRTGRAFYTYLGDMVPEMNSVPLDNSFTAYAVYDDSTMTSDKKIVIGDKQYYNGVLAGKNGGKVHLTYHLGNQYRRFHFCVGANKPSTCSPTVKVTTTDFDDDSKVTEKATITVGAEAVCKVVSVKNVGTITIASHTEPGCELAIADATFVEDPRVDCIEVARETQVTAASVGATSPFDPRYQRWYQQNGFHINGRSFTSGVFAIGRDSSIVYQPADLSHRYRNITGYVGEDDYSDGKDSNPTYEVVVFSKKCSGGDCITTSEKNVVDKSGAAPYFFHFDLPADFTKFALVTKSTDRKTKTAWVQTKYCANKKFSEDCKWRSWSAWSSCSASCGPGIQSRTRTQREALGGGKACNGATEQHQVCTNAPCAVPCEYSKWTDVVKCPACGPGTGLRVREVILGDPSTCTDYQQNITCADKKDYRSCPQDCKVSGWSDWMVEQKQAQDALNQLSTATCHTTNTQMYRKRVVIQKQTCNYTDVTADTHCGKACPTLYEERSVGIGRCPVDCVYTYQAEGNCSAQCGGGYQRKALKITTKPMFGGTTCPVEDQWERCNTGMCERDCVMGAWETNENTDADGWLPCDRTCGKGQKIRYRHEKTPAQAMKCSQSTIETAACDEGLCPLDCVVTTWSPWSLCEATCGSRTNQVRARTIHHKQQNNGKSCPHLEESRPCQKTDECPVECEYSEWSEYSTCTEECGTTGTQTRTRIITQQGTKANKCPAKPVLKQVVPCNRISCPQDCVVGPWNTAGPRQGWSECSKNLATHTVCHTAAQASTQMRTRPVIKASLWGGKKCPALTEHRRCTQHLVDGVFQPVKQCKSDCKLGDWSGWSQCSNTCKQTGDDPNNYTQERRRAVVIEAKHGGACLEDRFESRSCAALLEPCPTKCTASEWSKWGPCNVNSGGCGVGSMTRTRDITQGNGAYDLSCPAAQETRTCVNKKCKQDCLYGEYSQPKCVKKNNHDQPHTCGGGGVMVSSAVLLRAGRNAKGETITCDLLDKVGESCNTHECPVDCSREADGTWSKCSRKCGTGFMTRNYKVTAATLGGRACESAETSVCNTQPCPVDCKYSAWSDWLDEKFAKSNTNDKEYAQAHCIKPGVPVFLVRERLVVQNAKFGGKCEEKLVEYKEATEHDLPVCEQDCVMEPWSEWGACSVSCGGNMHRGTGIQTRRRQVKTRNTKSGMPCPAKTQDRSCNHQQCPIDCAMAPWSIWSKCMNADDNSYTECSRSNSHDDLSTYQIKWRSKLVQEQFGGSCDQEMTAKRPCQDVDGCKDTADMGKWSTWSQCTGDCGQGTRTRTRTCNNGAKGEQWKTCAATHQVEACVAKCDCILSDWEQDGRGCFHYDQYHHYEQTTCTFAAGNSAGLNPATQALIRTVKQAPNKGGKTCAAALKELGGTMIPNADANVYIGLAFASRRSAKGCSATDLPDGNCPINCEYKTTWENVGSCKDPTTEKSCGPNTWQTRRREISTMGQNGGTSCKSQGKSWIKDNNEYIKVKCDNGPCPVDCEVGDWATWMPCDRTCDPGNTKKSRKVLKRRIITLAQHGGACPNLVKTVFGCANGPCPVDCVMSHWSHWGKCSATCEQTRSRSVKQAASASGEACPVAGKVQEESRKCDTHKCNVTPYPTAFPTKTGFVTKSPSVQSQDSRTPTKEPTRYPSVGATNYPTKSHTEQIGDRHLTCNGKQSDKMDCKVKPYPSYLPGGGVFENTVCRQKGKDNYCNLCKCTAGGKVQCQKKICSQRVAANGWGDQPRPIHYQKCDNTVCTFEYKKSANKQPRYTYSQKNGLWKEHLIHDDDKFDPNTDANNVKFLKVIHNGTEKDTHHFCAYNLAKSACECKCWTPGAKCKANEEVATFDGEDVKRIKGRSFVCSKDDTKLKLDSRAGVHTCKWQSDLMRIKHDVDEGDRKNDHGYDKLRVSFQVRERGNLENNGRWVDYSKVELRVCNNAKTDCTKWENLKQRNGDLPGSNKRFTSWQTITSHKFHDIKKGHKFVQVQMAMRTTAGDEDYQMKEVKVLSGCDE
jgi:hypothetical protein